MHKKSFSLLLTDIKYRQQSLYVTNRVVNGTFSCSLFTEKKKKKNGHQYLNQ